MKLQDLTNKRFGKLTVLGREGHNKFGQVTWRCQCDCGNIVIKDGGHLKNGKLPSCGCADAEAKSMGRLKDLRGKKFGHLTVIERVNEIGDAPKWLCECDCDEHNRVEVLGGNLTSGHTTSCGCEQKRMTAKAHTTHGYSGTRIYDVYLHMKQRCTKEYDTRYARYGGRGITVCDEWMNDPMAFISWAIENGYDENAPYGEYTVERKDNDKGYSPENCILVNIQAQANNRSTNKHITYNGETHTVAEWSRILGINQGTLTAGLWSGMPFEHFVKDYKPRNTHPNK